MTKQHLFSGLLILFVVLLLSACATTGTRENKKIVIADSTCDGIVSIVNNGTMPQDSNTQSYDLVCEDDGKKNSETINVEFTETGAIKDVQVSDKTKAMGRIYKYLSMNSTLCEEGQVERCVTVCEFPQGGTPFCYYICVCTDH